MPRKKDITLHQLLTAGKFENAKQFAEYITTTAEKHKITITEMLIEYCEYADVDPVACASLLSEDLRSAIETEAYKLNLLKR